jgi:mannose-6-phosphate isomerase-like protein (cupin superfamily)
VDGHARFSAWEAKMRKTLLWISIVLCAANVQAQTATAKPASQGSIIGAPSGEFLPPGKGPNSVLHLTAAEVQTLLKAFPTSNLHVKSTDAGAHVVDIWIEHRGNATPPPSNDTVHSDMTEIYYILEGSGTLMTGATMKEPRYRDDPRSKDGMWVPSYSGKSEGGTIRKVGVGDVVVVPPWVVHQWRTVDTPVLKYLMIRIDPEHIQPPNFVHPTLKK